MSEASRRSGTWMAVLGALIALAGFLSYFLVAVWWPVLRDSALLNVSIAVVGLAVALAGFARGLRRPGGRLLRAAAASAALLSAGLLAFYVYHLSYQLPASASVIEEGARAPAFALRDSSGAPRRLEDLDGRKLILVFFRGHW